MDMAALKHYNKGHTFVLTVVDVLSKHAWAEPLKNKKTETVKNAFEAILKKSKRKPWFLMTDSGTEFTSEVFQSFMKAQDIQHYTANTPIIKAANAERLNRTVKTRLWKYFTKEKTFTWLDVLPRILAAINNTVNRMTKMRPVDVTFANERKVWATLYSQPKPKPVKFKYKVGDTVRVSRLRKVFRKGYLPTFSEEVFVIAQRLPRLPPVYRLKDSAGDMVKEIFYEREMVSAIAVPENPQKRIKRK